MGRKLEKGIRRNGAGLQSFIRVNGELRVQQWARETPRPIIRHWLAVQQRQRTPIRRGTLAADVRAYLDTIADKKARVTATGRFKHWLKTPLADKPRGLITPAEIKAQMARWQTDGKLATESINKLLTVLRALYRELNGDDDPNPAAKVKKLHVEKQPPQALTHVLAEAILATMPDRGQAHRGKGNRSNVNLAKVRLTLMVYTGWPPAQMMRVDPKIDIEWGPPVLVRLRPRRKGRGTAERWMPLTARAAAALSVWVEAKAYGPFSTSSVRRSWVRACKVYRQQHPDLPLNLTPYGLRHTFIAETLRASQNLAGTQYLAMHSDPRQTLHYARAAIPEAAQQAIDAAGVIQGVDKKP